MWNHYYEHSDLVSGEPEIKVIQGPPKSPDLNAIGNVWAELKEKRPICFACLRLTNRDKLWNKKSLLLGKTLPRIQTSSTISCSWFHWGYRLYKLIGSNPRMSSLFLFPLFSYKYYIYQWRSLNEMKGMTHSPRFSERKKKLNVHNLLCYRYILFIHWNSNNIWF